MSTPRGNDRPALGAWGNIPAPEVVELVAMSGLDFPVIDVEHGTFAVRRLTTSGHR